MITKQKNSNGENRTLIGIIGDTHDNLPMIDRAVKRLNREKVELVLHTGDYVSGFVIPRLKPLNARLIGVFGNNDGDHELLKTRFGENKRFDIRGFFAQIHAGSLKIALLHGKEEELLNALIESRNFDIIVHGHSHNAEVRKKGKALIINPGETCGYLTGRSTIALLDTNINKAEIIEL